VIHHNRFLQFAILLALFAPAAAHAHVGSKDVFQTVHAGPYTLFVTVRPPLVIPGVATVEIRSSGAAITGLKITPLPVTGEASKHPPAADIMQQNATDKAFFTGAVWMMAPGAWQVRIEVQGADGPETATVPVLAVPVATLHMQRSMGLVLGLLGLFLVVSMAGVVAASVREARLPPGAEPTPNLRRRGLMALVVSLAVMAFAVYEGGQWWNVEAADYAENVFHPTPTSTTLTGNQLDLLVKALTPEDDRRHRLNDDYLPDHGHLMHLYAIRWPQMDAAFHLHPTLAAAGDFRDQLPAMPPGHYRLFGDVVHRNGFPETLLATVDIPANMPGTALSPEDAEAFPPPLVWVKADQPKSILPVTAVAELGGLLGNTYKLPDGYTMVWDRPATLTATTPYAFHFRLLDPGGLPATDMQPYLGMAGHAAFVKTDGTVFAHTHPGGSAAMADVMLANASLNPETPGDPAQMSMPTPEKLPPAVDFPYGFPTPGRYRIFIQMKHASTVETGVFDAQVE
jgi:hypothetical protein